jgi:flavin reductase (DIM6/NTAB) family NADH-FMN oxidoreductase RutF
MQVTSEEIKESMRCWTTGVAIVSCRYQDEIHGMTVNSFISISIDPPLVAVTLAKNTRTKKLVDQTKLFGVTILSEGQAHISERFAGRTADTSKFQGIETFELESGIPFISGGSAVFECSVQYTYEMNDSVLYIALVQKTQSKFASPLVYLNKRYRQLKD